MIRWSRRKGRSTTVALPFVVDAGADPKAWNVHQRLLRDRIVVLTGGINDRSATLVIAQLLYLTSEDASAPIRLYINSPGGVVTSSLGIYDTMLDVAPPVESTCVGEAGGMAVLLLAAGQPGKRAAIPTARVLATRLTAHGLNDTTKSRDRPPASHARRFISQAHGPRPRGAGRRQSARRHASARARSHRFDRRN
ncbi:MAG: ATP-dependent Clp protease proteolytic subunit [Enhygromyxa sp.]